MYDKEKIKRFYNYTLEEYNSSIIIEDIVSVKPVEKTDGSFIQIGIRPLVDDEFLIAPNFDERLPGIGRIVASGEAEYLIKQITENKGVEKTEFKEDIKELPKYVNSNDIILLSTKFYVEFFTKLERRISYGGKHPLLDMGNFVIALSEKILGDKIIILDKNAIQWEKELFNNPVTNKKEKIDISVTPRLDKADILVRSVNKIRYLDPNSIRVLEVKK